MDFSFENEEKKKKKKRDEMSRSRSGDREHFYSITSWALCQQFQNQTCVLLCGKKSLVRVREMHKAKSRGELNSSSLNFFSLWLILTFHFSHAQRDVIAEAWSVTGQLQPAEELRPWMFLHFSFVCWCWPNRSREKKITTLWQSSNTYIYTLPKHFLGFTVRSCCERRSERTAGRGKSKRYQILKNHPFVSTLIELIAELIIKNKPSGIGVRPDPRSGLSF